MSDHPLSDDELLSAHLDGELADDARRQLDDRLAVDPTLRARLDEMAAAHDLAATAVAPLAAGEADRLIAAALAASTATGTGAANVTDLAAAATRRRAWPARAATVAAGVLLLALAVPALRAIDSGNDDSDASTADMGDQADDAGQSDGDMDDTADLSTESALEPLDAGPPAAADGVFGGSDDAGAGATAEDEGDGTDLDDADAANGAAFSVDQFRLFDADATFDPLADDLGAFDDDEALLVAVDSQVVAYIPDTDGTATTTTVVTPDDEVGSLSRDDLLDVAERRLEGIASGACSDVAEIVIDFFDQSSLPVVAADYGVATADGDAVVVGVFARPDELVTALVIDLETCELRSVGDIERS